jgi:hypothetical protein
VLGSAASCFRPSADRAEDETPDRLCHWPRCFFSAALPEDFDLVLGPLRSLEGLGPWILASGASLRAGAALLSWDDRDVRRKGGEVLVRHWGT